MLKVVQETQGSETDENLPLLVLKIVPLKGIDSFSLESTLANSGSLKKLANITFEKKKIMNKIKH